MAPKKRLLHELKSELLRLVLGLVGAAAFGYVAYLAMTTVARELTTP